MRLTPSEMSECGRIQRTIFRVPLAAGLLTLKSNLTLPLMLHNLQPTVQVDGDLEATSRFVDAVKIPYIAPSLGGCETLIEQPTVISYWDQGPAKRAELGIKDNLIRFSCGLEGIENIYSDIDMALSSI